MRAPELLDPASSAWTISAEPVADVLADLDPADLLLALPVPSGGLPSTGAAAVALALVGLDAGDVQAAHEPKSDAGSITRIPLVPGERAARRVLLVGV
ncbi:MAG: leucyl aminopeptidase, partial [Pedococcus sp.]